MISDSMKREIIEFTMEFSKGIIETCPETGDAYVKKEVTMTEVEDFLEKCKQNLLAQLP